MPDDILDFVLLAFPEALGAIIAASVLALVAWAWRRIRQQRQNGPNSSLSDKTADATRRKLNTLHKLLRDCPFCLVGGVYLDISVGPVRTTKLRENEWSNIDAIEYDVGGSTLWVGRFLWEKQQQSYLFSVIGSSYDPHTGDFLDLFEDERWSLNRLTPNEQRSKMAVTVHLIQSNRRFGTMFTHRGVLAGFGWDSISKQLREKLARGGVLYISGYFKTNLWQGLVGFLEVLPQNIFVCIDHGRLVREVEQGEAVEALRDAFKAGLVDLYFCTYNEVFDLFKVCRYRRFLLSWKRVQRMLQNMASEGLLPFITVVRGGDINGKTRAYAIVGKSVYPLGGTIGLTYIRKTVGPTNAFNANMIYHLVHDPRFQELGKQIVEAGNKAFEEWKQWTE